MSSFNLDNTCEGSSTLIQLKELLASSEDNVPSANVSKLLKSASSDDLLECALFAIENAVRLMPIEDLEEYLFVLACPTIWESFSTAVRGIARLDEGVQLTQSVIDPIYALLASCSVALQTLNNTCGFFEERTEIPFYAVRTLILTLSNVVAAADSIVVKLRSQKYAMCGGVFKDDVLSLKRQFLNILVARVKFCTKDNVNDVDDLSEIVGRLIGMLTATPPKVEEIGPTLETWKTVISLMQHLGEAFDVSDCAVYLCENLVKFLEKADQSSPSELKFYNTLLKILVKLCSLFRHISNICLRSIFSLLVSLFGQTHSFMIGCGFSNTSAEAITSNLANGAAPLLATFLSAPSPDFPSLLMEGIRAEMSQHPYGCLLLLLNLLKKFSASSNLRKAYFNTDVNIYEAVYESLGNCHQGIMKDLYLAPGVAAADLYQHTAITVSAFTLSLTPDEFSLAEETMWLSILQSNPWRALLASDVLCVVSRYADPSLCHAMVENMIQVLENIDDPNSRPEFIYLTALLKRMLPLCESSFIQNIFSRYSESTWVWPILGLHLMPHQCEGIFVGRAKKWLESSSENLQGLQILEALATTGKDAPLQVSISEIVEHLWSFECSSDVPLSYLRATLSISVGGLATLPGSTLSEVSQKMLHLVSEPSVTPVVLIAVLDFLDRTAACQLPQDTQIHDVMDNIGNTFKVIMSSKNLMLCLLALKTLLKFAEESNHTEAVVVAAGGQSPFFDDFASFVKKELPEHPEKPMFPSKYNHRCSAPPAITGRPEAASKKLKLEIDRSPETSELIRKFENDASQILLAIPRLTEEQRLTLSRVCQNIANNLK